MTHLFHVLEPWYKCGDKEKRFLIQVLLVVNVVLQEVHSIFGTGNDKCLFQNVIWITPSLEVTHQTQTMFYIVDLNTFS